MTLKKIPQKPTKQVCAQCEKDKPLTEYYSTKDVFFFPSGKISVCKICLYDAWEDEEVDGFELFKNTLRVINKPILSDLYKDDLDYKNYIRQINSLKQHKDSEFTDSDILQERKNAFSNKSIKLTELTPEELKEAQDFWGTGFEENEYIWLTTEYIDYIVRYGMEESKTLEDTIAEICLTRLDIRNRRSDNKDVDKQIKTLNDLMTSAGIKPIQESMASNSEQDTYGMWIKKLENERPISDPKPEWADVDGIRKYIVTFFLHPWARLFNKHKESPYFQEAMEEMDKHTVRPRHGSEEDY